MGLFGSKDKEDMSAGITDFFFRRRLVKDQSTGGTKKAEDRYQRKYIDQVDCLLAAADDPEKPLGKKEMASILFSVGAMTKNRTVAEPDLPSGHRKDAWVLLGKLKPDKTHSKPILPGKAKPGRIGF